MVTHNKPAIGVFMRNNIRSEYLKAIFSVSAYVWDGPLGRGEKEKALNFVLDSADPISLN